MSYADLLAGNVRGYQLIFDVEVLVREFLAALLEEKFGSKWPKQGLPADIRTKVLDAIATERKTPWVQLTPHHPLYYVDFPDLKKIINQNFESMSAVFISKANVESLMSELEPIRNRVAHCLCSRVPYIFQFGF